MIELTEQEQKIAFDAFVACEGRCKESVFAAVSAVLAHRESTPASEPCGDLVEAMMAAYDAAKYQDYSGSAYARKDCMTAAYRVAREHVLAEALGDCYPDEADRAHAEFQRGHGTGLVLDTFLANRRARLTKQEPSLQEKVVKILQNWRDYESDRVPSHKVAAEIIGLVRSTGEERNPMPKITNAFLAEVANGLYHSVSREWAMKMAQELIEARKKEKK